MSEATTTIKNHLPNGLTLLRLVLGVTFAAFPASWRGWIVLIALATEFLDGYLSRRWGATSTVGRILDPIADKVFVGCVVLTLVLTTAYPWWTWLLFLARDLTVATGALWCAARGRWNAFRQMPPRRSGKVATILQFAWLIAAIPPWPLASPPDLFADGLFIVACMVSAGAAVDLAIMTQRQTGGLR